MVTPAEGRPSGLLPQGTWMWMSISLVKSSSSPRLAALERTQVSAACMDSCLTSANLAGHLEAAFTLHPVGFDEQHIAARRCPGQPDRYTGKLGALRQFGVDAHLDAARNS